MAKAVIGGRRSAIEILFEMLSVCSNGGVNKTAIMYLSNLSYDQLLRYLNFMCSNSLVIHNATTGHYHITPKGQDTLEQVEGVINLLRDLQLEEETGETKAVKRPLRVL